MKSFHSSRIIVLLITLSVSSFFLGCSSTRSSLKFESLKYPASMSAFLYDQQNHPVMKGERLKSLHSFEIEKTFWAIGYGLIPLSSEGAIGDSLNALVERYDGDGILNLSVTIDQGAVNKLYATFLFIPSLVPIFPSSADILISGEIVKLLPATSSLNLFEINDKYIAKADIFKQLEGTLDGVY